MKLTRLAAAPGTPTQGAAAWARGLGTGPTASQLMRRVRRTDGAEGPWTRRRLRQIKAENEAPAEFMGRRSEPSPAVVEDVAEVEPRTGPEVAGAQSVALAMSCDWDSALQRSRCAGRGRFSLWSSVSNQEKARCWRRELPEQDKINCTWVADGR